MNLTDLLLDGAQLLMALGPVTILLKPLDGHLVMAPAGPKTSPILGFP